MINRKVLSCKRSLFFLKTVSLYKNNIVHIKIRIAFNNIFITYLLLINNKCVYQQMYSLKKNKLFKNKALLSSFLFNELFTQSFFEFFEICKKNYEDYIQNIPLILGCRVVYHSED